MYLGDINTSQILYFNFTTVDSTGLPTALSSSPVISIYKDDGTGESTTGVTLTASFDSRTGVNNVKIDTSADGSFYAAGHDFSVVITTGTVGGVSVVGYAVGHFSIDNRNQKVNATKIGGTTQTGRDLGTSVLVSSGTGTGQISLSSGTVTVGTNNDKTGYALTSGERNSIADSVWDEAISGHLTAGTTGEALNSAGSAGDPWSTAVPGAYSSGEAGYILGTNLNATISSVKAKTDNLPSAPAATGDAMTLTSGERTTLAGVIWNTLTSALTTAGSVGKKLSDWVLGTDNRVKVSADTHTSGETVAAVTARVSANIDQVDGASLSTHASGMFPSDLRDIAGSAVSTSTAQLGVNVVSFAANGLKKNAAFTALPFQMLDADGIPTAGFTVTVTRLIDNGSFGAGTLASVTDKGNGWYTVDGGSGDSNGYYISFRATATGAQDTNFTIITVP